MNENNFNNEFQSGDDTGESGNQQTAKMSNRKKILIAAGAVIIALVFFFVGWIVRYFTIDARARTLLWLIDTIDDNYYKEITDEEWDGIYDRLYDTVLPDQFCSYYSPEEYRKLVSESAGSNKNAGFSAIDYEGDLRVYNVVGNSPAALAGLKSGMYIYRMGTSMDSLKEGNRDALYSLSGKTLYLECGYGEEKEIYSITSGNYLASYCSYRDSETSFDFRGADALKLTETHNPIAGLNGETAYISIAEFNGNVAEEFTAMLALMKERGKTNLILDLRRNGGGYLDAFSSIASHLLKDAGTKTPVVATAKYRNGAKKEFRANGNDYFDYFTSSSSVYVLADERTASASECLIGALVDYHALPYWNIYLRKEGDVARTYGKGVMQSAYTSLNGSAVRVTSAEIFWPLSGKSIHGVGVTENDGAIGIEAPLVAGEKDLMLEEVLARLNGTAF